MNAPNRVDELRKRYHENPRRFFAPLANEYRKTGFVDRAILLCEKHLGEQPGNMNGLVVYGQCLFETGRLEEARQPFEMALAVDPENLIALRHLGDIARLGGDHAAARGWYEKVLEVDRRNDEVQALLAEVGGGEAKPTGASQAPNIVSVAGSVRVTTGTEALGALELEPALAPAEPPRAPTPPRAATPARPVTPARPATPPRAATPVDPSAKTVEVTAQPRPAKRQSLIDVSFDFGEIGAAAEPAPPPAPEPLLPSEAAEYGFAAPTESSSAMDEIDTLDAFVTELPSSPSHVESLIERTETPRFSSAIESTDDEDSLGTLPPMQGLEQANYEADVSPLGGLEPTEFSGGDAGEQLEGLDPMEFRPPDRPSAAIEGLESDEFQPLGLEEVSAPPSLGITHGDPFEAASDEPEPEQPAEPEDSAAPIEELPSAAMPSAAMPSDTSSLDALELDDAMAGPPPDATPADPRTSVAGLPLLEPFGTPTPRATPTVSDLPLLPSLEEATTVPVNLEAARREMETPATFVTETMAKVYVQQGHTEKAIEVYRQLIAQSPHDAGLRERLRELESPLPDISSLATPVVAPKTVDPRQSFGFDTPLSTEPIEEAAPANAMLKATSFDGISLATPQTPSRGSAPVRPPLAAPATGPSAREFFKSFVRRAATPASTPSIEGAPTIDGKLMSPLDELFGRHVAPEDEVAAHRLAGVGATSGPSGGSALDSLFGEGPSAPMPSTTPSRGNVTRASEKLRFDQFFASSTTVEGAGAAAQPEPPSAPARDEDRAPDAPGDDDDLDQFHGWLRGLTS